MPGLDGGKDPVHVDRLRDGHERDLARVATCPRAGVGDAPLELEATAAQEQAASGKDKSDAEEGLPDLPDDAEETEETVNTDQDGNHA